MRKSYDSRKKNFFLQIFQIGIDWKKKKEKGLFVQAGWFQNEQNSQPRTISLVFFSDEKLFQKKDGGGVF